MIFCFMVWCKKQALKHEEIRIEIASIDGNGARFTGIQSAPIFSFGHNKKGMLMSHEDIEAREKFLFTLEWLLAVTKRHTGGLQFGLAHINYETPKILGETYGAQKAAQKLDEVTHSLRKAFRKTDLVARDGTDFWILVPFAPAEEKLVDKIKYIIEMASQSGLQIVERDISIFSLPNDAAELDPNCTAMEFLIYLKKNHIALATRELSLPPSE